jgi:hypothetical protein
MLEEKMENEKIKVLDPHDSPPSIPSEKPPGKDLQTASLSQELIHKQQTPIRHPVLSKRACP